MELLSTSATELARAIRAKEVSSSEVVEAYLRRIEEINPKLNAVVLVTAERALAEAREADAALARGAVKGPLHGVPMTIKDAFETAGVISTGGTLGRKAFVPERDATAVARLRAAGAIMLGKTNCPELSLAFESDNLIYGRTNNPYDLSRTPGGSSGGEAAIIAACGSPLGLGSDAAGSIRLPSHYCGIAGIKPTTGRVPRTGHFPAPDGVTQPLWQVGPMARRVEDLILVLPIIAGVDWCDAAIVPMPLGDPAGVEIAGLRLAFYTDNRIFAPTPETVKVVGAAAKALADAGAAVEEAFPAGIEQTVELTKAVLGGDGGATVQNLLQAAGTTEMSPLLQRRQKIRTAGMLPIDEFYRQMTRWQKFQSSMLAFFQPYDVIVCPANASPAMPHGTTSDPDKFLAFMYTLTYNLTGWPGVVVRGGTSPEGLPIGVQVVAHPWKEHVALAVAQHLERRLGGWQPAPL